MQETAFVERRASVASAACAARARNRSARLKPRQESTPRCRKSRRVWPSQRASHATWRVSCLRADFIDGLVVVHEFATVEQRPEQILDRLALRGGVTQGSFAECTFPDARSAAQRPQKQFVDDLPVAQLVANDSIDQAA